MDIHSNKQATDTSNIAVAVIIPTYNRASLLVQTLASILSQTRVPDRIIVVDDGSSDETTEALKHYRDRIHYLRQENAGKPAALNRAMREIDADYVWIMDDDDIALPDALERHLDFLQTHPEVGFSYSGCYNFSGNAAPAIGGDYEIDDCAEPPASQFFLHCLQHFPFFMQSMLVPLQCYRRIGLFDEELKRGQDYDMILRLARTFRGGKIERPTFMLRQHAGARGAAQERHSAKKKHAVWRVYDLKLFAKVRTALALREYLPCGSLAGELTAAQTRRALLQRACVMAQRGLFAEALLDIEMATEKALRNLPFTSAERQICARMLNSSPALLAGHTRFLRSLGRLIRKRVAPLLEDFVKGLSWNLMREIRRGHYLPAAGLAMHLLHLTGLKALPALVTHRAGAVGAPVLNEPTALAKKLTSESTF